MKKLIKFLRGPNLDLSTHKKSIETIHKLEINERDFNLLSALVIMILFVLGCLSATNYYSLDLLSGMISNTGIQSTAAVTFLYGLWKMDAAFFNRVKTFKGLEEAINSTEPAEPLNDRPLDNDVIKNVVDELVESKLNEENK
jgi:hypothetical protein